MKQRGQVLVQRGHLTMGPSCLAQWPIGSGVDWLLVSSAGPGGAGQPTRHLRPEGSAEGWAFARLGAWGITGYLT